MPEDEDGCCQLDEQQHEGPGPAQDRFPVRARELAHNEVGDELPTSEVLDFELSNYIRSGAEIPSSPSVRAIVRFVSRQRPSLTCSTPSPSAPTTWQSR